MTLDDSLISDMIEDFGGEYLQEIEELGYSMTYGARPEKDSLTIFARVFSDKPISEHMWGVIGNSIIPRTYKWKGYEVPVALEDGEA